MMTEHRRVEDYFAGVLRGNARLDFERHLVKCTLCQERLKELRRLDAQLRRELPRTVHGKEPTPEWVKEMVCRAMRGK